MTLKSAAQASSFSERPLGELLADAMRLLRRDFYARAQGLNLTPALARLLLFVNRAPGSRQAELAAAMEITPVTLGRMIDRLVERRYLRRVPDPADRRAFRVHVDRAGEPLVAQLHALGARTAARAMHGISKGEYAILVRHLTRIIRNLSTGTP